MSRKQLKTLTTCVSHLMRRNNGSKNLNSLTIVLLILALYCISFGKEISWSVINGMNVIPLWICYVSWYHFVIFKIFSHISFSDHSYIWGNDGMCHWDVCGCSMWNHLLVDTKASGKVDGQCNSDCKSKISLWKDIPYSVSFTIHI